MFPRVSILDSFTDDYSSTLANSPVVIDVLTNDFDFDGDELTVIETAEPGNGQVEINPDGTVTYLLLVQGT